MDKQPLWNKLTDNAKKAGKGLIHQVLLIYYAYPLAPKKIQAVIASSIAYFILPLDAVPDPIPLIGFLDDATVLAGCLALVRTYVNDDVKAKASAAMRKFFKKPTI